MLQHVLKRIGLFCFWFFVIVILLYFKNTFFNLSELLFDTIFPTFILLLMSAIFLLYEASEFKINGKLHLYKANKILGIAILMFIMIAIFIFVRDVILIE